MKKTTPFFEHSELDGKTFIKKGNQIGILLLHGFTATTVEVRQLADFFSNKGFTVGAPLLPGHGTTPEDLNMRKYSEWINCVDEAYNALKKTCSSIIVGGESMGAILSLYLAESYPAIKALLLYAPAVKITGLKYAGILRLFFPFKGKKNTNAILPWQGYSVYPLNAAYQLFKLQKIVLKNIRQVNQPMIIFQGAFDRTIDHDSSDLILNLASSTVKTNHILANSGHVILLDKEFSKAAELSWKFLNELKIV